MLILRPDAIADEHTTPLATPHDYPSHPCTGMCGWEADNCHCPTEGDPA